MRGTKSQGAIQHCIRCNVTIGSLRYKSTACKVKRREHRHWCFCMICDTAACFMHSVHLQVIEDEGGKTDTQPAMSFARVPRLSSL